MQTYLEKELRNGARSVRRGPAPERPLKRSERPLHRLRSLPFPAFRLQLATLLPLPPVARRSRLCSRAAAAPVTFTPLCSCL